MSDKCENTSKNITIVINWTDLARKPKYKFKITNLKIQGQS